MSHKQINAELYPHILDGNKDAIDLAILTNLGLAKFLVRCHQAQIGYYANRQELEADATFELVVAINDLVGTPPHPRANLSGYLSYRINDVLRSRSRKRKQEKEAVKGYFALIRKGRRGAYYQDVDSKETDFNDALEQIMREDDQRIISLRLAGLRDKDISAKLGIPQRTVTHRRQRLRDKYAA